MNRLWTVAICALLLGGLGIGSATAQEEGEEQDREETMEALAGWVTPTPVEHDLEGRHACLSCHATGAEESPVVPQNHVDRPDDACLWCHSPEADVQTMAPGPVTHEIEGKTSCMMCHKSGAMESPKVPASHAGRTNEYCSLCHAPGGTTEPGAEKPEAAEAMEAEPETK